MTEFPYKIIDLSHALDEYSPSWDGNCGFKNEVIADYAEGQFRVQKLHLHAGIGTHMDAPAHCVPGGATIDELPLLKLISPCVVINVSQFAHERYNVSSQDIINFENKYGSILPDSFVMIQTGWERFWGDPEKYHNHHVFPAVSAKAAELLITRDVCGLGIDTLSPDRPEDGYSVHQIFLGNGKYLVENAANLEHLPPQGSFILALPIKIRGATEAPIRLVGLINKDNLQN